MSLIDCKVELGISASGYQIGNFQLNSAVLGILGTNTLPDLVWYDISSEVQSVQTSRGRSRQLDYFQGATATIQMRNGSRYFDPLNTASPYYPGVEPRCLIRVSSRGKWIFVGFVTDWDLEYDVTNQDVAVAYCADAFSILANQALLVTTPLAALPGPRINTILDSSEVKYRGGRVISTGKTNLGAYEIADGTNVLNYLRQIERSELGNLYCAANGDIVFRARGEVPSNPLITFNDSGSGIPYMALENQYGDELLFNYVEVQSPASTEIVIDEISVQRYQISRLSWDDLLSSNLSTNLNIAEALLSKYGNPLLRFTGLTVQLLALSDSQKDEVLTADLTDYLYVEKTFAVGAPASHSQLSMLTGVSHDIRPGSHQVTFSIENAEKSVYLVLGNSFAGQLDLGALNFS